MLDTGAAATTLVPELVKRIGYTQRDSNKKAKVHTAVSEEQGYWIRVAEFTVLGASHISAYGTTELRPNSPIAASASGPT